MVFRTADEQDRFSCRLEVPGQQATRQAGANDKIRLSLMIDKLFFVTYLLVCSCVNSASIHRITLSRHLKLIQWIQGIFLWSRRLPVGSTRAQRGRFGEAVACRFCKKRLKYRIIVRNWRCGRYEIDLVCRDGDVLVFIEVRARQERALISGYYSIDSKKKASLENGCKAYLRQMKTPPKHFRFDIIEVILHEDGRGEPRHYPNVTIFHKHYTPKSRFS